MTFVSSIATPISLEYHVAAASRKCYVIPVARACNARCTFCATETYAPETDIEVLPLVGLQSVVERLIAYGVNSFEITGGGEPTLHHKLTEIIEIIRCFGAVKIKMYTNGIRLPSNPGIDELNISRASSDEMANQIIMKLSWKMPETISETIARARRLGYKRVRLSVPLVKGGVSSLDSALILTRKFSPIVDGIVFRPLYPATPSRQDLLPQIDRDPTAWLPNLVAAARGMNSNCEIEVDSVGCFRSAQLILASNLKLYSDWSLASEIL